MKLTLSKEAVASLPQPGEDGVIRVDAGIKMGKDGSLSLVEVNDMPVGGDDMGEEEKPDTSQEGYADVDAAVAGLAEL